MIHAGGQQEQDKTLPQETVALPVPDLPEAPTSNTLDKDLQGSLRRSTYDFARCILQQPLAFICCLNKWHIIRISRMPKTPAGVSDSTRHLTCLFSEIVVLPLNTDVLHCHCEK